MRQEGLAAAGLVATVALGLWFFVLPRGFSLHLPIAYGEGDSLVHAHYVKRILTTGWFPWSTEFLGAPFGASELDMPDALSLHYLMIKALGLFSSDWVVVTNVFIVSGFFFAAIAGYWLLRTFQLEPAWAALGGLVFAFLPYHFIRLVPLNHLYLAAYWTVPFAVWLALKAWPDPAHEAATFRSMRSMRIGLAAALVAVGTDEIYYAFFACFLIASAGLASMLSRRALSALLPAGGMILAICLIVAAQLWPSIQHWQTSGANPETAARHPAESETYGLKLTQMLLPHRHHPFETARALSVRYNTTFNENESSALGVVASFGLIVLLAIAFVRLARGGGPVRILEKLALLAIAALMLGTVGGGGAMFAWIVTPMIRAYNRISIFIALLSVAAAVIAIDALVRRIGSDWKERRLVVLLIAVVVGLFALWDQTVAFDQARIAPLFVQDREVIQRAEAQLPADTMVYQLPYHRYPEAGPVGAMADYDLLRGFLHSTRLRWSHGGMKGRPGDLWFRELAALPIERQIVVAAENGFGAVYIDRRGFSDGGAAVESVLRERLGSPVAVDRNGHIAIYRMEPTGTKPGRRNAH
jgi:phosphoglycerol transferase